MSANEKCIKKRKSVKPWKSADDKSLSDKELRTKSAEWNFQTWETYLLSEVEVPQKDILTDNGNTETNISNFFNDTTSPHILPKQSLEDVWEALFVLTPKQQQVIYLLFWERKTLREISEILKISLSVVFKYKRKALQKLKASLESGGEQKAYRYKDLKKTKRRKNESNI